jgi:hypothetical protein
MAVEYRPARGVRKVEMHAMTVTEDRLRLEPVTADDFLAGLETSPADDHPSRTEWAPEPRTAATRTPLAV